MTNFGKAIRSNDFLLENGTTFINHGSYGCVPRPVQDERLRLMAELESNPDGWFIKRHTKYTESNLKAAAKFLGASANDVAFVKNTTSGCNCVLKSLPFKPGDAILTYSYTYKAVYNVCMAAAEKTGAEVLRLNLALKITREEEVIEKYRRFLEEHKNIKLVVLEYISSPTAVMFPVIQLTKLCKEYGAMVLVDGAHTPGQIEVNLEELSNAGVDFYTGSLHKWVFTPRGCGILWIHPKHHDIIRPVITSHSYNSPNMQDDFSKQGTLDNTPYFCLSRAIEYYEDIGGREKISSYSNELLTEASKMLCETWGTEMFPVPETMYAPYMRLVRVPELREYPIKQTEEVFGDMLELRTALYKNFKLVTVMLVVYGKLWVRLSASVYNTIQDYEVLRDAILSLKK